jgi:hypothetical protein
MLQPVTETDPAIATSSDCLRVGHRVSQTIVMPTVNTAVTAPQTRDSLTVGRVLTSTLNGTRADDVVTTPMISCADRRSRRCRRKLVIQSNGSG